MRSRFGWSMMAMSSGPRRLTRRFVRLSSLAVPVNSTKVNCAAPWRGTRLRPAYVSSSSLRSASDKPLDLRVRRVAGHLLDAEVGIGRARDLREVRDREELRARSEAARERRRPRARSRPPMPASISSKTIVGSPRRGVRDGAQGERDPRELAAGGGLGGGRERQPRVRAHEERDGVAPGRSRARARRAPTRNSPSPMPSPCSSRGDRFGERRRCASRGPARDARPGLDGALPRASATCLARRRRAGRRRPRTSSSSAPGSLGAARAAPRSSAAPKRRRASAMRSSSPSTSSSRSGLGLERAEERAQRGGDVAERISASPRFDATLAAALARGRATGMSACAASQAAPPRRSLRARGRAPPRPRSPRRRARSRAGAARAPTRASSRPGLDALGARRPARRALRAVSDRPASAVASSSRRRRAAPSSRQARAWSARRRSCSSPTKASSTSS